MGLQDVMNNSMMNELECFNKVTNPEFRNNNDKSIILNLFDQINNEQYLKEIATQSSDINLRMRALERINNIEILKEILTTSVSQIIHYRIAQSLRDPKLWLELFFRNYEWKDYSEIDPSLFYKNIITELKDMGYFKDDTNRDLFIKSVKKNLTKPYLEDAQIPSVTLSRRRQHELRDLRIDALESRREAKREY